MADDPRPPDEREYPRDPVDCLFGGGHVWMSRTDDLLCVACGKTMTRTDPPKGADGRVPRRIQ